MSPLTVNDYTLKDSFTFAKEVINCDHNLFMASPDVGSLFTNIPIDETIKNAVDDLFSSNMYRGKLSKNELDYLLRLATSESSFIFDNILYKQIDDVAMGLFLGPTLANAFLIDVHPNLNLLYREDISITYLFCLSPKIICYCLLSI